MGNSASDYSPPPLINQGDNPPRHHLLSTECIARDRPLSDILHSPNHVDCPACKSRSLVRSENHLRDMEFAEGFKFWLRSMVVSESSETSVRYIGESSQETYEEYAWALGCFFNGMILRDIHDGTIRIFQELRSICAPGYGWKKRCGQNRIRREVAMLIRMLRAAKVWDEDLKNAFAPLPLVDTEIPRAPEPDEMALLLAVMRSRDEWLWIYHYSVLALSTCASKQELHMARLVDLNMRNWTLKVSISASKNKYRNRVIPLETDEARESSEWLQDRSIRLGCHLPEHYLMPYGVGSRHRTEPTKHMSPDAMKNSWHTIREKAGLPGLRIYDLRHVAITRMAEAGRPIAVIQAFSGQMTEKMVRHYTAVSQYAMRLAAAAPTLPAKIPPHKIAMFQARRMA